MDNKLYKKLCPNQAAVIREAIGYGFLFLLILVLGLMGCYGIYEEGDGGALVVVTIILIGLLVLIGWAGRRSVRYKKQLNARKAARLEGLTGTDFETLENEILCEEMRFKTFYLLKEYIYAPKARLLLRYEEIGQWKTVRHSTNGVPDSVWIELTDTGGFMQKVYVSKWRQYLMELDDFVNELNFRKYQAMGGDDGQC